MFDIRKIQEQLLFNAIKDARDEETATAVVFAKTPENNETWVKEAMTRLEKYFSSGEIKKIRQNCQCGYGMDEKLILLNALMENAADLKSFAARKEAKVAGIFYENGELYLEFPFCPCPILAGVERLTTNTWCQCTTGYSKVLFEKAFRCPVEVELLQSIKMGDPRCLMRITPQEPVWK